MKLILTCLSLFPILACGCTKRDSQQASISDVFSVQITKTVTGTNSIKKLLTITFDAPKLVRIRQSDSSFAQVVGSPVSGSNTNKVSVTVSLSADLTITEHEDSSRLTYEYRISSNTSSAGGSHSGTVPSNKSFSDLVDYSAKEGKYLIGQSIPLGQVDGQKISLNVEQEPNQPIQGTR